MRLNRMLFLASFGVAEKPGIKDRKGKVRKREGSGGGIGRMLLSWIVSLLIGALLTALELRWQDELWNPRPEGAPTQKTRERATPRSLFQR